MTKKKSIRKLLYREPEVISCCGDCLHFAEIVNDIFSKGYCEKVDMVFPLKPGSEVKGFFPNICPLENFKEKKSKRIKRK